RASSPVIEQSALAVTHEAGGFSLSRCTEAHPQYSSGKPGRRGTAHWPHRVARRRLGPPTSWEPAGACSRAGRPQAERGPAEARRLRAHHTRLLIKTTSQTLPAAKTRCFLG